MNPAAALVASIASDPPGCVIPTREIHSDDGRLLFPRRIASPADDQSELQ